jgi:LacI family transcriptional regulator, galactose operon repressor
MSNQVKVVNGGTARAVADGPVSADIARSGGRPTMKDVASRAGVALKTVSRVVNREPGVTPETTMRVLGAIEALGFRRNESARLLRTGHTATLGYIAGQWTDPDQAAVLRGLERITAEHGYLLYSGSTDSDPRREEQLALAMCARRVDGLVICPAPGPHDYLVPEIEAGVATVFVLRPPELARADAMPSSTGPSSTGRPDPGLADTGWSNRGLADPGLSDTGWSDSVLSDMVLPDERGGARLAVAHLAALGHRKIGFLGGPAGHRSRALWSGYAEAMAAAGLAAEPPSPALDAAGLAGPGLANPVLAGPGVTAVFCADRERTVAAIRALGPSGVAVVGFGDFELAGLLTPPVTVVSYDAELIGRTAGELLLRRLAGEQGPPRRVAVPVRLITR